MKNTGKEYELLAQKVFQTVLDYDVEGQQTICVEHNKVLVGKSGGTHQIDVFWEFERAGVLYKTLVEVKDWKSKVKQEQIQSFYGVLEDIPDRPTGIFISRGGFQEGAERFARAHGIMLATIDQKTEQMAFTIGIVHFHTIRASLVAENEEEQPVIDQVFSPKAILTDKVYLTNPLNGQFLASAFINMLEEEQQRHIGLKAGDQKLDCKLKGKWTAGCRDGQSVYTVSGIKVDYAVGLFPQRFYAIIEDVPKIVLEYVLDSRKYCLEQDDHSLRVIFSNDRDLTARCMS